MAKLKPKEIWKKYNLLIIWIATFLLILILIICIRDPKQKISTIVQAEAVVTLVLVTGYYAIQTKRLVDEQKISIQEQIKFRNQTKIKSDIDFLERRIEEFFHPLWLLLNIIHRLLYTNSVHSQTETEKIETELRSLYFKKRYMTRIDDKSYRDLLGIIEELAIENRNNFEDARTLRSEYEAKWKIFSKSFNEEWKEIEDRILLYYMPDEFLLSEKPIVTPPSHEIKL